MSSANQLFLLADHIKLSLLERQRARTLHLDEEAAVGSGSQHDSHISRSLDQFREGIDSLQAEATRLQGSGDARFVTSHSGRETTARDAFPSD